MGLQDDFGSLFPAVRAGLDPGCRALSPEACADEDVLRRFVEEQISVNAWPIFSPKLRRLIRQQGIDLDAADRLAMPLSDMAAKMELIHRRALRVDRLLCIENAFHTPAHNIEVLLRLLCLEWPATTPMPEIVRAAPLELFSNVQTLQSVTFSVLTALTDAGVTNGWLARDLLAALGHDFAHSGGTDRLDKDGTQARLTHEEVAETFMGNMGVNFGFPAALILQSMAGIRATTFNNRMGRQRVVPANEFELKLTLADTMGCVLPPPDWLTHVGVPVLKEKIPHWKRRLGEIESKSTALRGEILAAYEGDSERVRAEYRLALLREEDLLVIWDLEEWFKSEREFFRFLLEKKLALVADAEALWGSILREKIELMESVLARKNALRSLSLKGFSFLEYFADLLANVGDLRAFLMKTEIEPELRELLSVFVDAQNTQSAS